ncbi:ATP-binding protein [Leisingera sp. SS27]|uniref:sensor histidine kinase n=1 Tax=Leisingera sp. SS27 TaxID=2979462 RepID=UPI00232FE44F|nr:ATP-binding protein [Leisingera sp. SS27]MDC0657411.1 ATP-binding protein [Leisingera sp. SS27]
MSTTQLNFDVSTGLKSVLGSELITDDEVAIFELVKNSFDAGATDVGLYFSKDKIVVSDNGSGMSYDDIQNKWLFVAYSSKRIRSKGKDFRDIVADRKHYAGSKGIGRFSSDRLGRFVNLQTRSKDSLSSEVHAVTIDWDKFDDDHKQKFEKIPVTYEERPSAFEVPEHLFRSDLGTVITVTTLRKPWTRDALKSLKSALAKLINPFGATTDDFQITMWAPEEIEADKKEEKRAPNKDEFNPNLLVNGKVGNFIFETLKEKTTFIEVYMDEKNDLIESKLTDRGELIYHIREANPYPKLRGSGFRCQIFFLNHSAKMTFARRVGVPSVQFGSVFLFRNGFRVFPIGESGDDWFGMERRKGQGYARFLGNRDVIGRLDVSGDDEDFQEASSRNSGLIATAAVRELRECFWEHCLKRLEKYVVPVTFKDKEDKNTSDISRLLTDPGRARVANAVAKLVDDDGIELIGYSERLIGILSERSAQFEASLTSLRAIARKSQDRDLFASIEHAERRFKELRKSEEAARKQADEERKAKEAAQAKAEAAQQKAVLYSEQLEEEKKRNLFLTSISNLDTDTILNLHHQVTIYSVDIQQRIENLLVSIAGKEVVPTSEIVDALDGVSLLNRKISGIAKFATKANFRLESEKIEANLAEYVEQYVNDVARDFLVGPFTLSVERDGEGVVQRFKPIDVAVIVDNLIANARKARATRVAFEISHPSKSSTHIRVSDNGRGFSKTIDELTRVFEKGYTTTDGSGLGLYHVKQVLGEMNGTIEAMKSEAKRGATFLIRISK